MIAGRAIGKGEYIVRFILTKPPHETAKGITLGGSLALMEGDAPDLVPFRTSSLATTAMAPTLYRTTAPRERSFAASQRQPIKFSGGDAVIQS